MPEDLIGLQASGEAYGRVMNGGRTILMSQLPSLRPRKNVR